MNITDFSLISFLIHVAVILTFILIILVPLPKPVFNSDVTNEFKDGKSRLLRIKIVPRVYTQEELNRPIIDFMKEEGFDLSTDNSCNLPFQENDILDFK